MKNPVPNGRYKKAVLALACVVAVLVASGGVIQATSSTGFCVSCHEMKRYEVELKQSPHAVDKDKKPIECVQCHLPADMGPTYLALKGYLGTKDILVHVFGDPDDMNRRELQMAARRFVPDDSCLACHQDLTKNAKGEPLSAEGKNSHDAYLAKNGNTKRNCAGCHQNMAHLPNFDRWYTVNAKFAAKLPPEEEKL